MQLGTRLMKRACLSQVGRFRAKIPQNHPLARFNDRKQCDFRGIAPKLYAPCASQVRLQKPGNHQFSRHFCQVGGRFANVFRNFESRTRPVGLLQTQVGQGPNGGKGRFCEHDERGDCEQIG
jgi:hypothetical protein